MELKLSSHPLMTVRTAYDLKPSITSSITLILRCRKKYIARYKEQERDLFVYSRNRSAMEEVQPYGQLFKQLDLQKTITSSVDTACQCIKSSLLLATFETGRVRDCGTGIMASIRP